MPVFIYRLVQLAGVVLRGWRLPLLIAVFVFLTSWFAMWLAEPQGADITRPENYWWYFIVTAATVGYGDFFPETTVGHIVGGYVIVGGIVTLTVLFTRLAAYVQIRKGKRMKGLVDLDLTGHVVIFGYAAGRTEGIVGSLINEGPCKIALCAWADVPEHPMPEHADVQFVRGDLTSADVMRRACVADAATVVIDGRDDNESLAIAVAAGHANPTVHMVVALRDVRRTELLRYVNSDVQCVQWHMPKLVVEEVVDPGLTQVYADLMSEQGTGNTYSMRLPAALAGLTFGEVQTRCGRSFGATLIAIRRQAQLAISPTWDTKLDEQMTVYYVAAQRIMPSALT